MNDSCCMRRSGELRVHVQIATPLPRPIGCCSTTQSRLEMCLMKRKLHSRRLRVACCGARSLLFLHEIVAPHCAVYLASSRMLRQSCLQHASCTALLSCALLEDVCIASARLPVDVTACRWREGRAELGSKSSPGCPLRCGFVCRIQHASQWSLT